MTRHPLASTPVGFSEPVLLPLGCLMSRYSRDTLLNPNSITGFATPGDLGRRSRDIQIYVGGFQHPFLNNKATNDRAGIVVWWLYTLLAFVTLFVTEKGQASQSFAQIALFNRISPTGLSGQVRLEVRQGHHHQEDQKFHRCCFLGLYYFHHDPSHSVESNSGPYPARQRWGVLCLHHLSREAT